MLQCLNIGSRMKMIYFVFGFEPNPESVTAILLGANKRYVAHGVPLEKKFIGKNFFLVPCA